MNYLYTANYGGYDPIIKLSRWTLNQKHEALYFSDLYGCPQHYRLIREHPMPDLPPVGKAKILKVDPWLALGDDWERAIWIDGNFRIRRDMDSIFRDYPEPLVTLEQPILKGVANSFYLEMDCIIKDRRAYMPEYRDSYKAQREAYEAAGMPDIDHDGLRTSAIIYTNTPKVKRLCAAWRKEMLKWNNWRDQPPLRYLLWKMDMDVKRVPWKSMKLQRRAHLVR